MNASNNLKNTSNGKNDAEYINTKLEVEDWFVTA